MVQLLVMSIKFTCRYSSTWCRKDNPGHGTRIARGWVGYRSYQHEFISITCLSTGALRDVTAPELQEVSLYQFI